MTDIEENKSFKNSMWDNGVHGFSLSEAATDIEGDHVFNELRSRMFDVDMFRDFVHDEESKTEIKESTGFVIPMEW